MITGYVPIRCPLCVLSPHFLQDIAELGEWHTPQPAFGGSLWSRHVYCRGYLLPGSSEP